MWPVLARMSNPHGTGPAVPRRAYVFIVLAGTVLGTVISLVVGLFTIVTSVTGAPVDFTGDSTTIALTIALVLGVTAAYYLFVLQRDQHVLHTHPVTATVAPSATLEGDTAASAPSVATSVRTLESVLAQVATRELSVAEAASLLREQFGAR